MVYYDLSKILAGIPISFLCGIFASLLISIERILISSVPFTVKHALNEYRGKTLKEYLILAKFGDFSSPITCFIGVTTFFIIFILLSYVLLSGQIRLYVFLVMLAGFFVSQRFLVRYLELGVRVIIAFVIFCVAKFAFVFQKIIVFIFKKLKFRRKAEKTIDNRLEIL